MDSRLVEPRQTEGAMGALVARTGYAIERALPARFQRRLARTLGIAGRWFIAPHVGGIDDIVSRMRRKGFACAVIDHPQYAAVSAAAPRGVLFDDAGSALMRTMLTHWPVGPSLHAFSTTGLPGFAFGDMPLLPPALARTVMDGAQDDGKVTDRHRALLAIYGALYFLGHDAEAVLADIGRKAVEAGLDVSAPATLAGLDRLMDREGWKPPIESLERLAVRNRWLAEGLERLGEWKGAAAPGWAVFYIRQGVVDAGKTEIVLDVLRRQGFVLPPTPALGLQTVRELGRDVRGGNWGRGPFPVSGGEPAQVVVAFDGAPIAPSAKMLAQYPLLDNGRIQIAKQAVRDALHAHLPKSKRYNGLHSTDNSVQAWRAIRSMYPQVEAALRRLERQTHGS